VVESRWPARAVRALFSPHAARAVSIGTLVLATVCVFAGLLAGRPSTYGAGHVASGRTHDAAVLVAAHTPHDDVGAIALSPEFAADRTIFALVRSCLFVSHDGGKRWQRLSRGLGTAPIRDIAVTAGFASDGVVYAAGYDGPYRSNDGGRSWSRIGGADAPVRLVAVHTSPNADEHDVVVVDMDGCMFRSNDGGAAWFSRAAHDPLVAALAWRAHELMVVTPEGGCVSSTDRGATWMEWGRLPDGVMATALAPDDDGEAWLVGTEAHGVLRAFGEPLEFEVVDAQLRGGRVNSLVHVGAGDERVLLASTWRGGPQRFDAAAADFAVPDVPLETHAQSERLERPSFGAAEADANDVFLATFCGLVHSSDGGRTWSELETLPRHLVMALDVVPLGPDAVALALSTYGAGLSVSSDGGATWHTSNRGLASSRTMGVALSPNHSADGCITSGSYDVVLHSNTGGTHWTSLSVGDESRAAAEDEETRPSPVLVAYSPAFERDRTVFAALHPSGLVCSRDGGASFARVGAGLESWPSALVVSPAFEHDRTVFVATRRGLFVSSDGGAAFEVLQSSRAFQGCFVALSPDFHVDGVVFAGGLEGLNVSRDRGRTFTPFALAPADVRERIAGMAVAPNFETSREFLVQVRGGDLFVCRDEPEGIVSEVSTAGASGLEFSALESFVREVDPLIAYSPNYERDHTIWASNSLGLFSSTDGGRSFSGVGRSTRVESGHLRFDGTWKEVHGPAHGHVLRSTTVGSRAWVEFVGTGATWIGTRGPNMGVAQVRVDGELVATVDLAAERPERGVAVHAVRGLVDGPHVFEITVVGRASSAAGSSPDVRAAKVVEVDAIDVELAP